MSLASKSQQASNASLKAASRILAVPPSPTVHPRFSQGWWKDWSVVFIVFAITGSTTVRVVKPLLSKLFGIEGTFLEGPWAYRLAYLATTLPLYSMVLIAVGTVFGRGPYFRAVAARMWGRFLPKTKAIKV
ncbi:hypothetical protein PhCBS80983_g00116 [Powellomyces hirtus]|uniref:DUF6787 domain-containing protein n=1 Tax=Powellomyces hirtus TaxID=109895 RepID=A0A507EHV7_9FUNG|nr:hypothetical protein PhCBS80983_g00116 [Powellomyces hirtus]